MVDRRCRVVAGRGGKDGATMLKGGRGKKEARLSNREVRGTHRGGGWRRGGTEVVRRREPTAVKGHHATVTLREGRAEVSYGGRNGRVWR